MGRAVVLDAGLTKVQYDGGGFGVVRVHVVSPGDWVGYYVSVSFVSRVCLSCLVMCVRGWFVVWRVVC